MDSNRAPLAARFASLLDEHRGIVFKVANAYCRDPQDRQDMVQEIATQAWRAFARYDPSRPFPTWMYRIALNVAISSLRRQRLRTGQSSLDAGSGDDRQAGVPPEALAVEDHAVQHERNERVIALYAVIDRLEPMDRALVLLWLDDRSQREIADILGISESNVATKLNRLKQRMRERLADHR